MLLLLPQAGDSAEGAHWARLCPPRHALDDLALDPSEGDTRRRVGGIALDALAHFARYHQRGDGYPPVYADVDDGI